MQFLIAGRQQGKTMAVARWARGDVTRQVVVPTERDILPMLDAINSGPGTPINFNNNKVVAYSSYTKSGSIPGSPVKYSEVAIDGLDIILSRLMFRPVPLVTATGSLYPTNTIFM